MRSIFLQIFSGIIALWLSVQFIDKVEFNGPLKLFVIVGIILGLINFFIKPVLKKITLPLTWLTLGLFSLIINMAMVWIVDILFPELIIQGIIPLFWTTVLVWFSNLLFLDSKN